MGHYRKKLPYVPQFLPSQVSDIWTLKNLKSDIDRYTSVNNITDFKYKISRYVVREQM